MRARREQQKDKKGAGAKDGGGRKPECRLLGYDGVLYSFLRLNFRYGIRVGKRVTVPYFTLRLSEEGGKCLLYLTVILLTLYPHELFEASIIMLITLHQPDVLTYYLICLAHLA